jgi:hypothetical protein
MDTFYDLTSHETMLAAAREFGRYHALLTGPIMARGLGLRGRLGETFFWYKDHADWDRIVLWLRKTITAGVVEEVWRWYQAAFAPGDDPLWESLAQEAGWTWWTSPGAGCAGDLVHEVGFHSFTWIDSPDDKANYRPETDFAEEAAKLVDAVARHGDVWAALGHYLEWSCCVGFQGSRPSHPAWNDEYFEGNTLAHQGGMLVRRMLAAHSQQPLPTFVTWYSSMDGLTAGDRDWGLYASCGLRNVLFEGDLAALDKLGPLPTDEGLFVCGTHAWPRPAWFTLRRLAWLLARARRVEWRYSNPTSGAALIRLVATGSFYDPLEPAAIAVWPDRARAYGYAYIAWVDGTTAAKAGVTSLVITLETPSGVWSPHDRFWKTLPLVPTVDCGGPSSIPPTDGLGFASEVSTDWDATPQRSTVTERWGGGVDTLEIEVLPSDPADNPSPICVLCDHEVVGLRLTRVVSGVTGSTPSAVEEAVGVSGKETVRGSTGQGATGKPG